MAFNVIVRRDLIALIGDAPTMFQFAGTEYTGALSGWNNRNPLEIGGYEPMPELTLAINLRNIEGDTVFGQDRPKAGDTITIQDVRYRIDRTEVDSFEECLQMDLRSINK